MAGNANEEFVLPERFRAKVFRRRGDGGAPTQITESLSEMTDWMDRFRHTAEKFYQQAIVYPESDPDLVKAATQPEFDSLTTASPLQAGLRAALIIGASFHTVVPYRFVDSWVLTRGHAFAVRAVAELHDVYATSRSHLRGSDHSRFLRGVEPYQIHLRSIFAARLLALLADATDAEYAEAMAAASEYRDGTPNQRALTSFLFRERTEWVDADIDSGVTFSLLAAALITADQARGYAARQNRWTGWRQDELIATMLASVGTEVAPLLIGALDDGPNREEAYHRLLALISELGSEESIRALTDRLTWKRVQGYLFAAGELFPRRTLRVLAETDPGAPAGVVGAGNRERWAQHVKHALTLHANTYADLAREELPTLSPAAQARVEAALRLAPEHADAAPEILPRILVSPPWLNRNAAAVTALMESDGAEELPDVLPTVPRWAESFALPQILVRQSLIAGGGGALPPHAVHHVGQMLALSTADKPHTGIEAVKEVCDAVSLREYAWALFENWQLAGYPREFGWVLHALRWFGDDEVVRRLTPLVRAWPGEGGHVRAVNGLDVIAAIGTDLALSALSDIAQRLKFKGLKQRAGEKIAEIAASLGLSAEQLADIYRPLPDGRALIANMSPGISVGYIAESPDQHFTGVYISRDGRFQYRPAAERSDPFGTLDPVTASEILRDLTEVTAQ